MIEQLASSNMNAGKGNKNLFKGINYVRGENATRIFFRQTKDGIIKGLDYDDTMNSIVFSM